MRRDDDIGFATLENAREHARLREAMRRERHAAWLERVTPIILDGMRTGGATEGDAA